MDKIVNFTDHTNTKINGVITYQEGKKLPAVIISHGFLSYKENKLLYKIANALEDKFVVLRFDFSGCMGGSQGTCNDMMLTHQVSDLNAAINFIEKQEFVDKRKIALVGHSLGGLTSLIVAARDRRVRSLITIAAPAKLEWQNMLTDELGKIWKHDRVLKFKTDKKSEVEINYDFYKDLKEYDGEEIAKNIKIPFRIIQGDQDNIVEMKNADILLKRAKGTTDLQVIKGGDHMFLDPLMSLMVSDLIREWLVRHL
ncbi:MAG: alpha/beta hydrolase [Candidatus Aenigmatarchaeota archaeon]